MYNRECIVLSAVLWITVCCTNGDSVSNHETFSNFLSRSWKKCLSHPSIIVCMKQRSLLALDKLTKGNDNIEFPGDILSLVKNKQSTKYNPTILSEEDLEKHLPKNLSLQEKTLDLLLQSAYTKFLSSRSLQVRLPWSTNTYKNAEESRGDKKNKGGGGFAMGCALAAMTMVPMALAGIGMLAGKSLMVSMLALMLSALLGMKKNDHGGGSSYEVISIPAGGGHSHHGRSLEDTFYTVHGARR